ncbi:LysM peptidoglycan-binding domain-containing protein [Kribbella sp. NPDC026611]|uniref:LysM peptidoglycan-binding domain-containing protein n=1 Tax=Kribbella sp. NPDC026611 TaxID=3154911 RepID=UPI0033CC2A0F
MTRVVKGGVAGLALVALGCLLRWMTAGSISGLKTYDLDSMTVLAVGTVAWIAYTWLTLAVAVTVLEQLPGALGALAGALASRITTQTAQTLLRSSIGVAAVTPLTVTAAHATPNPSTPTYRTTEPPSTLHLAAPSPHDSAGTPSPRPDNSAGSLAHPNNPTGSSAHPRTTARPSAGARDTKWAATEPQSTLHLTSSSSTPDWRSTEPPSTIHLANQPTPSVETAGGRTFSRRTAGLSDERTPTAADDRASHDPTGNRRATDGRVGDVGGWGRVGDRPGGRGRRVGVPDRPAEGAGVRYTDLRSGVPGRVVVREGDSLWAIAARELGPGASNAEIAARWPDWYAVNRRLIGPDPELILPGQVLRVPPVSAGPHVLPNQQEK